METTYLLFALLRSAVCGEKLNTQTVETCTPEALADVYALAKRHDLAHLVAHALEGLALPECEAVQKLKKAKTEAIYRYVRQEYEYGRIREVLVQEKIPFIPLKGTVLRTLYPEPWMRTSCDIDVLVKPENLEQAVQCLEQSCGYHRKGKGPHDISMFGPGGFHFELHYDLIEDADSVQARAVLQRVWDTAVLQKSGAYAMTDSMFCFYHVAHMAKHFLHGGCGIRSFLDLWIWEGESQLLPEELLRQGGLLAFSAASRKLARCWFSGLEMDENTRKFAKCVLSGGAYGTADNRITAQKASGRREKLPMHRILIPYEDLRYYYPVVEEKKWMIPICQLRRWFRLAGNIKGWLHNRRVSAGVSPEARETMTQLLRYLEL